ncbi:MAG TPA: copper transporter [Bacillota bacterium]|nr:copper transporter [Bacillota bacterium]HPZ90339.1 copper transporter [Bacillota bacterium]HQE01844.1 copper transporter [Bacillota bacterium]
MATFRFHVVTVMGIFLALALGIFIGSTFTEEGIILQQRGTIERMRANIDALQDERRELRDYAEGQARTIALLEGWLEDLLDLYWQKVSVSGRGVLICREDFAVEMLEPALAVVQAQIKLPDACISSADLAAAVRAGDVAGLHAQGVVVEGSLRPPDFVLLALNPGREGAVAQELAEALLAEELQVIALGTTEWEGLADLTSHRLYYSVSHLDTPMGLYCLGAILQGQGGHYGADNILPFRREER